MMLMPLAYHLHINAILALYLAFAAIPMASVYLSLYAAGRRLTPKNDRSQLGIWLGRLMLWKGIFLFCITALQLARWTDLDPDIDSIVVSTIARSIGAIALTIALICAWMVGPIIFERLRQGSIGAMIDEEARRDRRQDERQDAQDERAQEQDARGLEQSRHITEWQREHAQDVRNEEGG